MASNLGNQIAAFFSGMKPDSALLLTTFGLDEVVLAQLLVEHKVPSNKRVIVFHEVMKHRNPGFLRCHFPASQVVSVELERTSRKHQCPVFHSKLWLEVTRHPLRCVRLAVLTFNLTSFHLDKSFKTYEGFAFWKRLNLRLPQNPLFTASRIFRAPAKGGAQNKRIKLAPATIFFDLTAQTDPLSVRTQTATNLLASICRDHEESVKACAGPFVGLQALRCLASLGTGGGGYTGSVASLLDQINVWSGQKKDGTRLHAKLIALRKLYVYGSVNITSQALGLNTKKPINHETIVLAKRPKGFNLAEVMRGFKRFKAKDLDETDQEPPCDLDPTEDMNWREQKLWSTRGPDAIRLHLNKKTHMPEIRVTGRLGNIDKVVIEGEKTPGFTVAARRPLTFSGPVQQAQLANALLSERVLVKGIKKRKTVWARELDFGDFWVWLEKHGPIFTSYKHGNYSHGMRGSKITGFGATSYYDDVRQLRQDAYEGRIVSIHVQEWHNWLRGHCNVEDIGAGMPRWCISLAQQLRDRGSG